MTGCQRCDRLAGEVMRLREDRNGWRAVAVRCFESLLRAKHCQMAPQEQLRVESDEAQPFTQSCPQPSK